MKICGIDPGANGAICVLDDADPLYIRLLDFGKFSIFEATKWLHALSVDQVWIEDVHSIYGSAARANFNFGKSVGYAHAIAEIVTQGQPAYLVAPKVWQKYIGITSKGKAIKQEVHDIATCKYPSANLLNKPFKRKGKIKQTIHDGRSDALMIAYYGLNHKDR